MEKMAVLTEKVQGIFRAYEIAARNEKIKARVSLVLTCRTFPCAGPLPESNWFFQSTPAGPPFPDRSPLLSLAALACGESAVAFALRIVSFQRQNFSRGL